MKQSNIIKLTPDENAGLQKMKKDAYTLERIGKKKLMQVKTRKKLSCKKCGTQTIHFHQGYGKYKCWWCGSTRKARM